MGKIYNQHWADQSCLGGAGELPLKEQGTGAGETRAGVEGVVEGLWVAFPEWPFWKGNPSCCVDSAAPGTIHLLSHCSTWVFQALGV